MLLEYRIALRVGQNRVQSGKLHFIEDAIHLLAGEVLDGTGTSVWYEDDSTSVPTALPYCEDFSIPLEGGAYTVLVGGWQPVPFDYTLKVELL